MPPNEREAADKLADALRQFHLEDMAIKAENLYYSDFSSPDPHPKITLVQDILATDAFKEDPLAVQDLIDDVKAGEFDG